MKSRFMVFVFCLLAFMPRFAFAQTARAARASAKEEPPPFLPLHASANTIQPNEIIAPLIALQPVMPMGPVDVLKAYEDGMTLIAERLSEELMSISQASRANQITRDQAEHLILDRYQVAMMQHATLSALHTSLEYDIAQASRSHDGVSQPDTPVVVQPPASSQIRYQ